MFLSENIRKIPKKKLSPPVVPGSGTVINHSKQKESETIRNKFLVSCTELIPITITDNDFKIFRIYGQPRYLQNDLVSYHRHYILRIASCSNQASTETIKVLILILTNTENFQSLNDYIENVGSNKLESLNDSGERGSFKADLRAILELVNSTNPALIKVYDIANCEVAKNGKAGKVDTDNSKLLIEAKVTLDHIFCVLGMKFDETKKLSAVNLQIAGLKAQLVPIKFSHDQTGYTTQLVGKTIIFPIASENIENFFNIGLSLLYYWKTTKACIK
ncbi:unnamed protein product [Rhizopus stolonifer]